MWKYIIGIIVLAFIDYLFKVDPYKSIKEKRKKRLPKSFVYLLLAGTSYFICRQQILGEDWRGFFANVLVASLLFAIGSFLSAINPNLREIYGTILFNAAIAVAILFWLKEDHFIWFCILEVFVFLYTISCSKDLILDMKNGIDPDVVEADKEAKKKARKNIFKIAKIITRAYKI